MNNFWILIVISFFATNLLDKAKSVQLEDLPLQTFDELFVEEWLDKDEAEELTTPAPTNFGQNVHHQIDRQNTQIEPNSTDQNPLLIESDHTRQIETNSTDQLGQIKPNSADQSPSLTESDQSDNAKNGKEQNEVSSSQNIAVNERKRKIINKFHAIKNEFKQKGKYLKKEWVKIEEKIAKHLKVNRSKIYEWKKEFGLSRKVLNEKEKHKHLVEKFDKMRDELKRDGFKNSYKQEIDKIVAKVLGISFKTIYAWKREFGQTTPNKHSHSEQKELMKSYYEIKDKNSKFSDEEIAKILKIGRATLIRWKKQFKRHQLHLNSVDGHSVEENAAQMLQENKNLNSGSI